MSRNNRLTQARAKHSELGVQLRSLESVVKNLRMEVEQKQKELQNKMETNWERNLVFFENCNAFHDECGISSPWWNNALKELANSEQGLIRNASVDPNLQYLKDKIKTTSETLERLQAREQSLNKSIIDDEEKMLELKKTSEILRQEPFTDEFSRLREHVETSRATCSQLGCELPMTSEKPDQLEDVPDQEKRLRPLIAGFTPASAFYQPDKNECGGGPKRKVFRLREKTTVFMEKQAFNNATRPFHS